MASSGAMRPAVGHVLQLCHLPSRSGSALPLLCVRPSSSRPMATAAASVSFAPAPRSFSTTARLEARKTRDRNKLRGVSTIHRSGPRDFLSVTGEGIPQPDLTAGKMGVEQVDPDHGLWDFFYQKRLLPTPSEEKEHGRAWTTEELRAKNWDDLHALWWVCCKERNRISTSNHARNKGRIGFGGAESTERDATVRETMKGIKHVLTERYYAWEDAVKLAKKDPEINLDSDGPLYTPRTHLEEEEEDMFVKEGTTVVEEAVESGGSPQSPSSSSPGSEVDPSTIPTSSTVKSPPEASPRV